MLTNIVSHSTPRVRSIQISPTGNKVLGPVGVSLLKTRHRQQTRAYRFGMWSSYLDPEFHRDIRRRHRTLRYKYSETMSRRLSWEQNPSAEDSKAALRRMAGRYWYPGEAHCGSRFVTSDEGIRKHGRKMSNDRSVDDGWTNISPNSAFRSDSDSWKSQLDDMVNQWTKQASQGTRRARSDHLRSSQLHFEGNKQPKQPANDAGERSSAEQEYVIDPISNRKVPKGTYGFDRGVVAAHDEQFNHPFYTDPWASFDTLPQSEGQDQAQPIYSDGPPPPAELDKYAETTFDSLPKTGGHQSEVVTTDLYSTTQSDKAGDSELQSEEYALNHLPPEDPPEEPVVMYEDLDQYKPDKYDEVQKPVERPVEMYEDLDKYKPEKYDEVEKPVEPANEKYEDLDKYKPDKYDEVDGPVEAPNEIYEDLDKYQPDKYDDPTTVETNPKPAYDDLHKYKPYLHEENVAVDETKEYEDLDKYEYEHREDTTKLDERAPEYDDLDKYNPTEFPDGVKVDDVIPEYEDLDNYDKPFHHEEDKQSPNSDPKYKDLDKYASSELGDSAVSTEIKPFQQYDDLENYKAYRFQEPGGKSTPEQDVVADSLREYDTKSAARENMELAMDSHIAASDAADKEASASLLEYRQSTQGDRVTGLTGNFVRDFPEEFSTSWGSSRAGLQPRGPRFMSHETSSQGSNTSHTEQHCVNAPIQSALSRLESALNRNSKQSPTTIPGKDVEAIATTEPNVEPTTYKVLAYNPVLQDISIAETTSVVPDQATPLTPAEVLLRLSNPAKFLPYFSPLQDQGFEIVSGSGDILVFRRIRAGSNASVETQQATASSGTSQVNPIDMMGRAAAFPNAASFASPTGFVNYDGVPFRSNIDVRREEPVFSGPKTYTREGETYTQSGGKRLKKKRSFTKRLLIGGVWVAGVTYALGVVGQYFATGGMDGRGPTGF